MFCTYMHRGLYISVSVWAVFWVRRIIWDCAWHKGPVLARELDCSLFQTWAQEVVPFLELLNETLVNFWHTLEDWSHVEPGEAKKLVVPNWWIFVVVEHSPKKKQKKHVKSEWMIFFCVKFSTNIRFMYVSFLWQVWQEIQPILKRGEKSTAET